MERCPLRKRASDRIHLHQGVTTVTVDNGNRSKPILADLGEAVPWGWDETAFWRGRATGPVDRARTAALADPKWDVPIQAWSGHGDASVFGVPYQLAQERDSVRMWDLGRTVGFWDLLFGRASQILTEGLPYPAGLVRIELDPNPGDTDRHSILWAPARGKLYEAIDMRRAIIELHGAQYTGHLTAWDTTRPWAKTQGGAIAAKIPLLPLLPRWEEIEAGTIAHMLGIVMDRYNKAFAPGTPVRGTDALSTAHPVRTGERLRITDEAFLRLLEAHGDNPAAGPLLTAARDYGFVVTDKRTWNSDNDPSGWCAVAMPADTRFADHRIDFRLSDLEIVAW